MPTEIVRDLEFVRRPEGVFVVVLRASARWYPWIIPSLSVLVLATTGDDKKRVFGERLWERSFKDLDESKKWYDHVVACLEHTIVRNDDGTICIPDIDLGLYTLRRIMHAPKEIVEGN